MIEAMQGISFAGNNVLDFGTGTGVLAILAEKMGAREVVAVDNDDWSIENATWNIKENLCNHISILKAARLSGNRKYEVILANINKNVLMDQMDLIADHLEADGTVVMSGLLTGDEVHIKRRAAASGLTINTVREREGWIALCLSPNRL
jgi:ribosomal protein L11 methyltransferase